MKNRYEIRGKITAIFLDRKDGTLVETLIDTSCLSKVNEFKNKWTLRENKKRKQMYVQGHHKGKSYSIHRFIMDCPKGYVVDHIDHDTLNNCKSNLRIVTNAENQQNRLGAKKGSKSGVRGVYWHKGDERWRAQVSINKKTYYLGEFKDIKEAEQVVIEARKKYMPFSQEAMEG